MKSKQKLSAKRQPSSSHKKIEQSRVMNKSNGIVKAYSANTFQGLVRDYNQDRVSIILNITKPQFDAQWPKCSYFGVFDGHGGCLCSDFLRDNLHKYIIQDKNFPFKPVQALRMGFIKAQSQFLKIAQSLQPVDRSGSCAIIALIVNQRCYIANVGDSRAILSQNRGFKVSALSVDHKPNSKNQRQRIQKFGGRVYQSNVVTKKGDVIVGPHRVFPGRLSVSRAIGDIQAKLQKYQGNPNVLIGEPQIKQFVLNQTSDFILIGCDGIFDRLSNQEVVDLVWNSKKATRNETDFLKEAVSAVLQQSMLKKSLDNLTAILVLVECRDNETKKRNNNVNVSPFVIPKREPVNQQKLKISSKKDLFLFHNIDENERPSVDRNKQNTNTVNLNRVSDLSLKNSLWRAEREKQKSSSSMERSKQKQMFLIKTKDEKDVFEFRKRQSGNKKVQQMKYEELVKKNLGDLMRY